MKSKHSLAAGLLLLMAVAAGCSSKEPENIPAVNTEKVQDTKKADEEEVEPERKEDTEKEADFVIPEQGKSIFPEKSGILGTTVLLSVKYSLKKMKTVTLYICRKKEARKKNW